MIHRRLPVLVGAGLSALLVVGGCGMADRAGAAAVVNGQRITTGEVYDATEQVNSLIPDSSQRYDEARATLLLVASDFILERAEATGSWAPDAAYNAALARIQDPTPTTVTLLQTVSAAATLQPADVQAVFDDMAQAEIDIDPRIGRFDPQQESFVPVTPNWLTPDPAATSGS